MEDGEWEWVGVVCVYVCVWGGEQRVCFWRVSAAHMLSKES